MPSFMNFDIAIDNESKEKRDSSTTGYIDSDEEMLINLNILQKIRGVIKPAKFVKNPSEIREFITWASGNKKVPLPPLARRILCLKRELIKNSIASIGPSKQQRTGEKQQLAEIDALLREDGAVDLDNKQKCEMEGSRFIPKSKGGTDTKTVGSPGSGCTTTVNCGPGSEITSLINEIKTKLDSLSPNKTDFAPLTTKLDVIESEVKRLTDLLISSRVTPTAPPRNDANSVRSNGSNISVISARIDDLANKIDKFLPQQPVIVARAQIAENGTPQAQPQEQQINRQQQQLNLENSFEELKAYILSLQPNPNIQTQLETLSQQLQQYVSQSSEQLSRTLQDNLRNLVTQIHQEENDASRLASERLETIHRTIQDMNNGIGHLIDLFPDNNVTINTIIERLTPQLTRLQALIEQGFENTGELSSSISEFRTSREARNIVVDQKLREINEKLNDLTHRTSRQYRVLADTSDSNFNTLKELIEATRCPELNTEPILDALNAYTARLQAEREILRANDNSARNIIRQNEIERLENRVSELHQEIERCSGKNVEIANLRAELESVRAQLESLQTSTSTAHGQVANLTAAAEEKNRRILESNARIASLEAELLTLTETNETKIQRANDTIQRLENEAAALNERLVTIERKLREATTKISESTAEMERLNKLFVDLSVEKERLEKQLNDCEETKRSERLELENRIRDVEQNLQNITAQKEEYERQLKQSGEQDETIRRLTEEKLELEQRRIECESDKEELKTAVKRLQEEKNTIATEKERLVAALEELTEQKTRNLKKAHNNYQSKLNRELLESSNSIQEALDLAAQAEDEKREIEASLGKQIKKLQEQLRERQQNVNISSSRIKELERKVEEARRQLKDCEDALNKARQDSTLSKTKISQLQQQLDDARQNLEEKTRELTQEISKAESDNRRCSELEQELQIKSEENASLKEHVTELTQQNSTKDSETASLKEQVTELTQQNATKDSENASLKEQVTELTQEVANKTREINDLHTRITELEAMTRRAQIEESRALEEKDKALRNSMVLKEERNIARQEKDDCEKEKRKLDEILKDTLEKKTECEMKRSDAAIVEADKKTNVEDILKKEPRTLLPVLKNLFQKVIKYSNKGGNNSQIVDVSGKLLEMLGAYNIRSEISLKTIFDTLFKTRTGETIKRYLKPAPGLSSIDLFKSFIFFLYNLPPEITNYNTYGGRRTVRSKEKKSLRYSRKQ